MKSLDELDHYEVLEVPPGAGYEDIERAYQMTRAAYTDGSMALYSVFDTNDAAVIRSRIDEAYRVLADPDNRGRYDAEVGISHDQGAEEPASLAGGSVASYSSAGAALADNREASIVTAELSSAIEVIEDFDAELDEESQDFDGGALRRARLRRGVELDQISSVTKISVRYLTSIEEEEFEKLPASVYVRGFVSAYARAIGLDGRRVSSSYMLRVDAVRNPPKRS